MLRNHGAGPAGFQPGGAMARELRFLTTASSYNPETHTVEGVFATGSPVRRFGFVETLNMAPGAVDLSRVAQGQCKLLDSHNAFEISAILGVVEIASIQNGQLAGRIRFAETDAGRNAEGMVARGELTGFSIGYSIQRWVNVSQEDTGVEEWRADAWTLLEVTLCAVPADPAATVRAAATGGPELPAYQATQEDDMTRSVAAAAAPAAETPNPAPQAPEMRAAPPAAPGSTPAPAQAAESEARAAATPSTMTPAQTVVLLERAEFYGQRALAERMLRDNAGEAEIIAAVQAAFRAEPNENGRIGGPRAQIGRDETETRRQGMEDALSIHLGENTEPSEPARRYMESRYLFEFAAEAVGHRGRLFETRDREDVLRRAFHSTSDFPILLENALNRALRARYAVAEPTYRRIAQQRTYLDFRDHISVRDGDFPQLKEVKESGELQGGTFSESKEKTAVKAYGVRVGFTRQLLINDNLGAIQRVLNSRATAVARFEDETFYAMMLSANGAGPTLLETSRAVFNATDKTLAASGSAINNASLGAGRAAMRKRKTKDGTFIATAPAILLVGPDKETEAQSVLSPLFAAQASNVPLFANSLALIVSPQIVGNAWYLFSDITTGANFEWGLLEGYNAPRMRLDEPFGMQGMSVSLEHDFGCGAIDFRFGYQDPGA